MRLRERDKRELCLYRPGPPDDDVYRWQEPPECIRAALYPLGSSLDSRVYGDAVKRMMVLLYDGPEEITEGMGIALPGGRPEWRISSVERWDHVRAMLERIPEGRRT